mmetsp:Transcript_1549/g.2944  ORF Transcript_1549/g.2944 Transcript_1549/m.2944 type:complete len:373 (+) Transcript_1549:429-1547(+)
MIARACITAGYLAALLVLSTCRAEYSNAHLRTRKDQGRSLSEVEDFNSEDGGGEEDEVTVDNEIIPRIVDGTRAKAGRYPYYTAIINEQLGVWNSLLCGGTLIAEDIVLSAAHCTDTGEADKVKVGAYGAPGRGNDGEPYHVANIVKRVNHPKYNPNTLKYDVALYKIDRPVTNRYLLTNMMKLDYDGKYKGTLKGGESMAVVGLGYLDNNGRFPAYLQEVSMSYVPNWNCRLKGWPYLSSDMMCATDPNGKSDNKGQDSCQGDSGGPIIVQRDGKDLQVGIVSYGSNAGCGVDAPGVYSRISESSSWIKETICEISPSSSICPSTSNPQYQCSDLKDCSYISNKWRWVRASLCLWDDLWQDCDATCNRCDA